MTVSPEKIAEMLPCPFCGAAAEMEPWHGGAPTKQMISCSSETCDVCPMVTGETTAEAITLWNTRTPPQLSGMTEETSSDPSAEFAAWVNAGPKLALAAGVYVGITVYDKDPAK